MKEAVRNLLQKATLNVDGQTFDGRGAVERLKDYHEGVIVILYDTLGITNGTELKSKITPTKDGKNKGVFEGYHFSDDKNVRADVFIEQTFADDTKDEAIIRFSTRSSQIIYL